MSAILRQSYLDKIERYLGKDTIIILTPLVDRQDSDGITHIHLRRFLTKGLE